MKTITKIDPMMHGHLKVEFSDGTSKVLARGEHLKRGPSGAAHEDDPKVGDEVED